MRPSARGSGARRTSPRLAADIASHRLPPLVTTARAATPAAVAAATTPALEQEYAAAYA